MLVNIEFLSKEPIENTISSLHYKYDKVVFFCFESEKNDIGKSTVRFLRKYCNVEEVKMQYLSEKNLNDKGIVVFYNGIRKLIETEKQAGNDIVIDITGGDEIILVAFGMLAKEYNLPVHQYDFSKKQFIEFEIVNNNLNPYKASVQNIVPTIDMMLELYGCCIDYNQSGISKYDDNDSFAEDVRKMFEIESKYRNLWNTFIRFSKKNFIPGEDNKVLISSSEIRTALSFNEFINHGFTQSILDSILLEMKENGMIDNLSLKPYSFIYKNENIIKLLGKEGNVLEQRVLVEERAFHRQCLSDVVIDWDGHISAVANDDVSNEIDVISLDGYIMTFISCKCGKLDKNLARNALYELDTVANRFGGKYVKKKLAVLGEIGETHANRAKEMGIEIKYY